ncbi:MAG: collagenase [Bradymonadales bacterium]|nr:collagenase [Bradymonadales bacterium]
MRVFRGSKTENRVITTGILILLFFGGCGSDPLERADFDAVSIHDLDAGGPYDTSVWPDSEASTDSAVVADADEDMAAADGETDESELRPALDSGRDAEPEDGSDAPGDTDGIGDGADAAGEVECDLDPRCCALITATSEQQVWIVEQDLSCLDEYVSLLVARPFDYLESFYELIASPVATDALFSIVYDELRFGRFRFDRTVVDALVAGLPEAVSNCVGAYRCEDWSVWIVSALYVGRMYRCPELAELSASELLISVPYGDYDCTEGTALALGPQTDQGVVGSLLSIAESHEWEWSRRNGMRILGRLAEGLGGTAAQEVVVVAMAEEVLQVLEGLLTTEVGEEVLHDVIWVLNSFFFPFFEMQEELESIVSDPLFESSLRWRAMNALGRLFWAKPEPLDEGELDFLVQSLSSDDLWVRAEAAFICWILRDDQLEPASESALVAALQDRWATESELVVLAYLALALDRFEGTSRFEELRDDYETEHLGTTASGDGIILRSGLPSDEIELLVAVLEQERAAFFDLFGSPFDQPIPGDVNETVTVLIFASRDEYREYMEAFVGYAADAGGLYVESSATLYTWQRTPDQSVFTLQELLQHEYGHYLQGRHLFPGLWSDPGYHDEPKGWADEGLAELLGGLSFDGTGGYDCPLREYHADRLCGSPYRDLAGLLSLRAGYDQEGIFDYTNAYALAFYLATEREVVLHELMLSFREEYYHLADFAAIAGISSVESLQADWHVAIDRWCSAVLKERGPRPSRPLTEADIVLRR